MDLAYLHLWAAGYNLPPTPPLKPTAEPAPAVRTRKRGRKRRKAKK